MAKYKVKQKNKKIGNIKRDLRDMSPKCNVSTMYANLDLNK